MRDRSPAVHPAGPANFSRCAPFCAVFSVVTLIAAISPASAREYGPGDVSYLVNLWNTNRERFEAVVQGVDTFSALGTVKTISKSKDASAFQVIVDVGLNARISCASDAAAVAEGDTVTVSGRIATAASAAAPMKASQKGEAGPVERARDGLTLRSCTVQKALRPAKS